MTTLINTLPERKAFTPEGVQLGWDSVSLGAAKKCPRYYFYSILSGWTPRSESPHLKFGILFHSALEELDHARVQGPLDEADLIRALRNVMKRAGSQDPDTGAFKPWLSAHPTKNLESLVRAVIWYFYEYINDNYKVIQLANGRAAVELSFRFNTGLEHAGEHILYCGHLDSLGEYVDNIYGLDRKSTAGALTSSYFSQYSPSVQITGYNLASRLVYNTPSRGVIIDAAQVGAGFVRFGRHIVSNTEAQLEEWLTGTAYTIQDSHRWLNNDYWPMNESACRLYAGCTFQSICSKDPTMRERFLSAEFTHKAWDPLEPRGVGE